MTHPGFIIFGGWAIFSPKISFEDCKTKNQNKSNKQIEYLGGAGINPLNPSSTVIISDPSYRLHQGWDGEAVCLSSVDHKLMQSYFNPLWWILNNKLMHSNFLRNPQEQFVHHAATLTSGPILVELFSSRFCANCAISILYRR
mgnify:CR=1 FL=1